MKLSTTDIKHLAQQSWTGPACTCCAIFTSTGWESFPSLANDSDLRKIGSLWIAGDDEPSLAEYHPEGTSYWSPSAPIALDFHPYNRCEIWQCRHCNHPFLRYTEYGGYYEDQRIRELDPALIT